MANYSSGNTYDIYQRQQARQDNALGQAGGMIDNASAFASKYTQPDDRFRNALSTSMQSETNRTFNNTLAGQRQRANLAGFGYATAPAQAGADQVETQRAAALSQIPLAVDQEVFNRGMQASQLQQALAGLTQQQAQIYDPQSYYQLGAQQYQQEQANKGAFWKSLANLGLGIGSNIASGGWSNALKGVSI